MAQTKYTIEKIIGEEKLAEQLKQAGYALDGVKWVNINLQSGDVVLTHDEDYNESDFQKIIDSL